MRLCEIMKYFRFVWGLQSAPIHHLFFLFKVCDANIQNAHAIRIYALFVINFVLKTTFFIHPMCTFAFFAKNLCALCVKKNVPMKCAFTRFCDKFCIKNYILHLSNMHLCVLCEKPLRSLREKKMCLWNAHLRALCNKFCIKKYILHSSNMHLCVLCEKPLRSLREKKCAYEMRIYAFFL